MFFLEPNHLILNVLKNNSALMRVVKGILPGYLLLKKVKI